MNARARPHTIVYASIDGYMYIILYYIYIYIYIHGVLSIPPGPFFSLRYLFKRIMQPLETISLSAMSGICILHMQFLVLFEHEYFSCVQACILFNMLVVLNK